MNMKYFIAIFLIMLTSGCHHINKRQNGQAESNGQIVKLSTIVTEVQKVVDIYAYWAKSEVGSTPLKSAEITLQNGFESKSGKGISFFLSYSHESVVTKNNLIVLDLKPSKVIDSIPPIPSRLSPCSTAKSKDGDYQEHLNNLADFFDSNNAEIIKGLSLYSMTSDQMRHLEIENNVESGKSKSEAVQDLIDGDEIAQQGRDILCGIIGNKSLETNSLKLEVSIVGSENTDLGFTMSIPSGSPYVDSPGVNLGRSNKNTYGNKVVFTFQD